MGLIVFCIQNVFVMGDLNAKVGCGKQSDVVGPYGLDERNERGDIWVQWCEENDQVIATLHTTRDVYGHGKAQMETQKNQIDFITIDKRFRNAITQVKSHPGEDGNSDHVPIVASVRIRLKNSTEKNQDHA